MAAEDKGTITCPFCKGTAPVRKNRKGWFYYHCPTDGIVQPGKAPFQEWVMDNATLYGGKAPTQEAAPVPTATPLIIKAPEPTPAPPAPANKETPKATAKKSIFDYL